MSILRPALQARDQRLQFVNQRLDDGSSGPELSMTVPKPRDEVVKHPTDFLHRLVDQGMDLVFDGLFDLALETLRGSRNQPPDHSQLLAEVVRRRVTVCCGLMNRLGGIGPGLCRRLMKGLQMLFEPLVP